MIEPRRLVRSPLIGFEDGWRSIDSYGIKRIKDLLADGQGLKQGLKTKEYADLYTVVYKMCNQTKPHKHSQNLYKRFGMSVTNHLREVTLPAVKRHGVDSIRMLEELGRRWSDHLTMTRWFCAIFMYLDRFYVERRHVPKLEAVCRKQFRGMVFDVVREQTTRAALQVVEMDRQGKQVDRTLLRKFTDMYIDLGADIKLYKTGYEAQLLRDTTTFYSRWSNDNVHNGSKTDYLTKVEKIVAAERARIRGFVHTSSRDAIMKKVFQALLINHQTAILGAPTGFKQMLDDRSLNDISRVYRLYNEVPKSLQPIAEMFLKHIQKEGADVMESCGKNPSPEEIATYVPKLVTMHERNMEVVHKCFKNNGAFHKALKEGFMGVANNAMAGISMAELLSNYSDLLLRKTQRDANVQIALDNLVDLFSYLSDKDQFLEFYKKRLATRILTNASTNDDKEKSFIGKMKTICGAQFTGKLEGMINDITAAMSHNKHFQEWLVRSHRDLGFDFNIKVLTHAFWPAFDESGCELAPALKNAQKSFEKFWSKHQSRRTLKWIHSLGVVTMEGQFAKKVQIQVSTTQACMLMLLNGRKSIQISEIIERLKVDPAEIKRQLKPLTQKKYKVVKKEPFKGYNTSHHIMMNRSWDPPRVRVKIPLIVQKTTKKQRKAQSKMVAQDRQNALDGAIVRVMKARKTLEHVELIREVTAQLSSYFVPQPKLIKERIEDLIQHDYLMRHPDDRTVYKYVA